MMKRWMGLIVPLVVVVIWEAAAIAISNPFILPRLGTIIDVLMHPADDLLGTGSLLHNAWKSIQRVGIGFFIAAALGIPCGIAMGRYQWLNQLMDTTIQALRPIPPLAWVPLALAWFRIGLTSIVFIIFIGAFFPILINTIDGVKSVKKTWMEVAMTLGTSEFSLLTKVILPGAAPIVWTGLRLGFGIAWMTVVAAEMLPGTTSGLGYLIMYAYNFGQVNVILAGMVAIGLIGIMIDAVFRHGEKIWFGWRSLER